MDNTELYISKIKLAGSDTPYYLKDAQSRSDIEDLTESKQDKLTAGAGIYMVDNILSATLLYDIIGDDETSPIVGTGLVGSMIIA